MRTTFCTLLAFVAAATMAYDREKFDPKRDAAKDIAGAVKIAQKQNKRILLDVGGEWCIWCKKLDNFFETDTKAAKLLHEKFVVVKVNFSEENKNEAVLSKYPKKPPAIRISSCWTRTESSSTRKEPAP